MKLLCKKAKWHYEPILKTLVSSESRLLSVFWFDKYLMISRAKVQFRETPCNSSRSSSIVGIGKLSLIVIEFKAL